MINWGASQESIQYWNERKRLKEESYEKFYLNIMKSFVEDYSDLPEYMQPIDGHWC